MWLIPWASMTAPTPHRNTSRARLIASRSFMGPDGTRSEHPGRALRLLAMPRASTVAKVLGVLAVATAGALAVQEARKRQQADSAAGPVSSSSRASRSAALAGVGARTGGAYAVHRARRAF